MASDKKKSQKVIKAKKSAPKTAAKSDYVAIPQMTKLNLAGRKNVIDVSDPEVQRQLLLFGKLHATQQEMADWFDCSLRTVQRQMAKENGQFCRIYKKGAAETKISIKRKQLQKAYDGDNTMLIWLGKILLKQGMPEEEGQIKPAEGQRTIENEQDKLEVMEVLSDETIERIAKATTTVPDSV